MSEFGLVSRRSSVAMSGGSFWRRVVIVVGLLTLSASAWAEPTAAELQVARRLFQRATADEELGRWDSALKTLREVEAIKVTAGVLFHVAVCEQNLERYVEALNDLGRADELAQINGDKSVLELIPERRRDIEAMIGHLRIELVGAGGDVEVRVDGERISPAALRVDIPLDPKRHTVAVMRPNKPTLARTLLIVSGSRQTERFDLTPAASAPTGDHATTPVSTASVASDSGTVKKVVMYSAYAVALIGAGTGVYFLLDANKHDDDATSARQSIAQSVITLEQSGHSQFASGSECSPPFDMGVNAVQDMAEGERYQACAKLSSAIDDRDRSQSFAIWSFAIAGAGAVGGTAVLLFWPDPKPSSTAASLRIAPTLGGAVLSGTF